MNPIRWRGELASFSRADYSHARRVMLVAARCAAVVGADERVCSAAGMYYRIGVLEGAPLAKNGVKMAQRACFPEKVIRIIGEYNGEERSSAIHHRVGDCTYGGRAVEKNWRFWMRIPLAATGTRIW